MAKVQVVMAMTLDGFLPEKDEQLIHWIRNRRNFTLRWREECIHELFPHYPLLDLLCRKENQDNSVIYRAEVFDREVAELLHGLFLYNLVDEIILYQIPVTHGKGISLTALFQACDWTLHKAKAYRNNVCCLHYKRKASAAIR